MVFFCVVLAGAAGAADREPSGAEILEKSLRFLGSQPVFRLKARQTMTVEGEGMLTRWQSDYDVVVARPDRVACILTRGIMGGTVVCDGSNLTVYLPAMKSYTREASPGSLDKLARQVDEGGPLSSAFALLNVLLSSRPYEVFSEDLSNLTLKATEKLAGVDTYHLGGDAGEMGRVEIWIQKGATPLLRRVTYDLSGLMAEEEVPVPGAHMELSIVLDDWRLGGKVDPADFQFTVPAGARPMNELLAQGRGRQPHPLVGKPAPEFELPSLEGKSVKLSDYLGTNVMVLDFWTTWCGPCRRGLPAVSRVAGEFADRGVVFFAVNQGEDAEKVKRFLEENKLQFTVLMDRDGSVGKSYGVRGIPQTVVIGRDGRISAVHVGFGSGSEKQLRQELEKAVRPPAPETTE